MKNQYFGDVNDYRKYGLIRLLTGLGQLSTSVCWMLTPDDNRTDGKYTGYLDNPAQWRKFDPVLFDKLQELVIQERIRNVSAINNTDLLHSTKFYSGLLLDTNAERAEYFESFWQFTKGVDLIFFDPDNGIEVKSTPIGRKNSSKYIYWNELVFAFSSNHSVLVYQHFPRIKRDVFITNQVENLMQRTGAEIVYSFVTANVVLYLFPSLANMVAISKFVPKLSQYWNGEIKSYSHTKDKRGI